jgi:YgiT-type zinc finger domain-containing protein
MTEQCAFCGNKHLTPKTTRYLHQHDEQLLIVDGVPCLECDFCGEQYFEIDVLKRMRRITGRLPSIVGNRRAMSVWRWKHSTVCGRHLANA